MAIINIRHKKLFKVIYLITYPVIWIGKSINLVCKKWPWINQNAWISEFNHRMLSHLPPLVAVAKKARNNLARKRPPSLPPSVMNTAKPCWYTTTSDFVQRRYDMNGRSQMQGGKNLILPKDITAKRL